MLPQFLDSNKVVFSDDEVDSTVNLFLGLPEGCVELFDRRSEALQQAGAAGLGPIPVQVVSAARAGVAALGMAGVA